MKTQIGIIGDGQLALMLAEALTKMKKPFLCFSKADESPMHTHFPDSITKDPLAFKNECHVFTLENEFHSISELQELLAEKTLHLFPHLESYSFFANKISQRTFYKSLGINSPNWMALHNTDDLQSLNHNFNYPFVLKTSHGGYDGKGVRIIRNEKELQDALRDFRFFEGNPLLIEEKIQIKTEVAQGFLKNRSGQVTILPLVETIQENGVCNLVRYPSQVSTAACAQIASFLERLTEANLIGIFNFEFFIDHDERVLINEGAPRTHNSQHLTIDASPLSQFDLLALYLTDPKDAPNKIHAKSSVMINILGQRSGNYGELKLPTFQGTKMSSKLYGKKESFPGRKMGHVNVVDEAGGLDLLSIGKKILKEYEL